MKGKVFVTGASGFIGSNLTRRLVADGYEVTALLRPSSKHPLLDGISFEKCPGDLSDKEALRKGMEGARFVIHSAAKVSFNRDDYEELCKVNVEGTENVLAAAKEAGVERVVFISASAVFGYSRDKNAVIDETASPEIGKESVYAYTKKAAEGLVLAACSGGLDCVIVNPSTTYGAGDETLNSGFLVKAIYKGTMRAAPPGGTTVVSVDDVVSGIILAMNKGTKGERYILAAERFEFSKLCQEVAEVVGGKTPSIKVPSFFYLPAVAALFVAETFFKLIGKPHPLLTVQIGKETFAYKYYSSKKARRELGWEPAVEFKGAVLKAFNYYKDRNLL